MQNPIIKESVQVDSRLHSLDLDRPALMEVVWAMVAGRANCTENDAPSAPGTRAYLDGTRRLREVLCPKHWVRSNEYNIPCVVHPTLGVRITVGNTDDGTGQEDSHPQHWSKRGPANRWLVSKNCEQMHLLFTNLVDKKGKVVPFTQESSLGTTPVTWYLCVFSEGDTVRAELSCPVSCEKGYFTDFVERIILIDIDGFGTEPDKQILPNDEPDVEISVTRKS